MKYYELSNDKYVHVMSRENKPILTIEPGSTISVITCDPVLRVSEEGGKLKHDPMMFGGTHPAIGPICVQGAQPGDALQIRIIDIEVNPKGYQMLRKGKGFLKDWFDLDLVKLFSIEDGFVRYGSAKIPISPMVGTIGVASAGDGVPTPLPGDHGGNLDVKEISAGNTLYLPVFVPGGLLALCDVHAVQSDGEVCVTAIECGARVIMKIGLCKNMNLKRPRIITKDRIICLASADTIDKAAERALKDAIEMLESERGIPRQDAYMLFSLIADMQIAQVVNVDKTVKVSIDKVLLESFAPSIAAP